MRAGTSSGAAYPLVTRALTDGRAQHLALGAGSAAYLRLAVGKGAQASVALRDGGAPLPGSVRVAVVRVK